VAEQVVVSCRMSYAGIQPARAHGYLERARALTKRAEALGATLVAWSAVTVTFAWDTDSLEEAITLAASLGEGAGSDADAWACGVAQGEMEPLAPHGQRADLAWGPPLVQAVTLARVAAPGEVLVDASVEVLRSGELLTIGTRIVSEMGRRVRGARLDVRQPWKRDSASKVESLVDPPFFGQSGVVDTLVTMPGSVAIVRADPGLGGSRVLREVAARVGRAPCLRVAPCGFAAEPLGALRRAFARKKPDLSYPLAEPLDRLIAGEGVTIDVAAGLIVAALRGVLPPGGFAAILIDDAADVDGVTLEACARAMTRVSSPILFVVRLDATAPLPEPLAALPHLYEMELRPLDQNEGQELAAASTGGALVPDARARWARRGGYVPLAILEAVACGLATGELAWIGDTAFGRRRVGGRGKPRPASHWLTRRAEELPPAGRAVLSALALLGGEATRETLMQVLAAFGAPVRAEVQIPKLVASRWLREPQPGWLALLTRSHREAVIELLHDARVRAWHRAVARTLEAHAGPLGRAEAAYHAAKAGDGPWAARLALAAAEAASGSRLEGSAMRLIAFARAEDPSCEEEARRAVAASAAQAAADAATADSEPPTMAKPSIAPAPLPLRGSRPPPPPPSKPPSAPPSLPSVPPSVIVSGVTMPSSRPGEGEHPEEVAERLTELARQALLGGDAGALERWCNGLKATGEHDQYAERLRAMAHLSHGQIAHAVVALRRARARLEGATASASSRSQASLALAVALAHAGSTEEALLNGLDALARAREGKDPSAEKACVTFLAKLFDGVERGDEAQRLRDKVGARAHV
jgi:hypothetical protein